MPNITVQKIDKVLLSGSKTVKFSATVGIVDTETDEEKTYQIVGKDESNLEKNKISFTSPIAKSLIGKSVGDEIVVKTPKGEKNFEIISVDYI